jgi:hypothetical protein
MAAQTEISPPFSAPSCPHCGMQMLIVRISRDWPTYIQRTYQCPWCPHRTSEVVGSPMVNPTRRDGSRCALIKTFRGSYGSFAIFAAIRRTSSRVSME